MYIQWFGQSFFKIIAKNEQGQEVVLAIDPYDKKYGLKPPAKFGADLVLITHDHGDHNNVDLLKGTNLSPRPFVISGAGEYEAKGVMIYGVQSFHDDKLGAERGENTIYLINVEEMWLAHLGDLGQKKLTEEQLEMLEDADILLVPVGGTYTIDATDAVQIISQIEPRIIIPMHYQIPGLNLKLDGPEKLIKEIGLKPEEQENSKIRLTKKDLPQEDTRLIILKP